MKRETRKQLITFLILFIFLGSSLSYAIIYVFPTTGTTPTIDGIQCSSSEQTVLHIHSHLDVYVNGQQEIIPANIGITSSCLYWLHTHDTTGVIHIESPYDATFYLGQFLDIWQNSTVDTQVPSGIPTAYVNGSQVSGDYKSIPLGSYNEITLIYGTAPSVIPQSYNFPSGL